MIVSVGLLIGLDGDVKAILPVVFVVLKMVLFNGFNRSTYFKVVGKAVVSKVEADGGLLVDSF